ncbi:WhiB family transcriptional regulator [Rhodococcus opacus PD630]|nr:WhiB family transcriptional regulator [Rhodococcus opacus PD630]
MPTVHRPNPPPGHPMIDHTTLHDDLPTTAAERWGWRYRAHCRTTEPSAFFAPDGERRGARIRRERRAKQICDGCVVARQCRAHATEHRETHGIWGGTTETERRRAGRAR